MGLSADYNNLCPLFDFSNSGGVVFPFVVPCTKHTEADNGWAIDFEDDSSTIMCRIKPIMDMRVISCQVMAAQDSDGNTKTGTCSTEPVISFIYGTAGLASGGAGTALANVTCTLTGDLGTVWGPGTSTTATTFSSTQEIAVYLSTAAAEGSYPSGRAHGAGLPIIWFAHVNAP